MTKRVFLSGVGIAALAGAIGAAPAHASGKETGATVEESGDETGSVDYRLPASETTPRLAARDASPAMIAPFAGFDNSSYTVDIDPSLNLATLRSRYGIQSTLSTGPQIEQRLISRADVDPNGAGFVDVNETQPSVVQLFSQRNSDGGVFLNCTGTVINPRTILTAAHCVTASTTRSSEAYGLPETGADRTVLVATGFDTSGRLDNYLATGANYAEGGLASSTDVVIHSTANVDEAALPFPWADIALVAVDTPITDVPSMPILLSPLTELTHVVQVGYGTFGDAFGGGTAGSSLLRRVGENMLGALANFQDITDIVFANTAPNADLSQNYYFTDFDWPDRGTAIRPGDTEPGGFGCDFNGNGAECTFVGDILANDWFDGDALPNEAATAPGDSGSPLIVDQLYDFPVVVAVLSGGLTYPGTDLSGIGLPNTYGDISFYNPLYPFFEFISENTAYKYVSALGGDGMWSDPTHWTQDLDPGFFIDDGTGTLVNGLPEGPEPGIYASGPKLGTVLGVDISGNPEGSLVLPPDGIFFGIGSLTPNSSALLGPGSTGFVPNNTDGMPGISFANPAQYFEVHLNRAGTTTVDIDVEIDRLVIDNEDAGFVLASPYSFSSLIDVEQLDGYAEINGALSTPVYTLATGVLAGDGGSIDTNVLFNVNGLIDAGSSSDFGSLTIGGDYVQTSGGVLWTDFTVDRRRNVTSDFYDISGVAVLDGVLVLSSDDRRVRFGTEFTILSADSIDGDFAQSISLLNSVVLEARHRIDGSDVVVEIGARSIRDIVGSRGGMRSLGATLDAIRADRFSSFTSLFDVVDNAGFDTFGNTLVSLTPTSAFSQNFTANAFSQRFTGQVAQRTLSLRGGSRAAGGFTAAGNASYALAGSAPVEPGQLGIFGSASGIYLNGGRPVDVHDAESAGQANVFEQLSLTQAGEITMGADLRVTEGFAFGIAVSNIRSSQLETGLLRPEADHSTSVAIYGTYDAGGLFADGYAGTADLRLGATRASQGDFASIYDTAMGQSDSEQVFGGLRLGYAFDLASGLEVGPVVSMDYVSNSIRGFDEIGAGTFGLSVDDRTFTSLGAKVGAMASLDLPVGETGRVRAFGSVAYARELADNADVVTAHFFGAEDLPFSIRNELDPQWVSVNAGAEIDLGTNLRAALSVTSDMGRGPLSNEQAQATLSWRF
ncbi:MAG: autotransporter domain-containing protein [Erythrobacter sp.]